MVSCDLASTLSDCQQKRLKQPHVILTNSLFVITEDSALQHFAQMAAIQDPDIFLAKFDQVLLLLENLCSSNTESAKLSEEATFLLEKTLDLLVGIQSKAVGSYLATLYDRPQLKNFLGNTLRVSRAVSVPSEILIFAIRLSSALVNSESRLGIAQQKLPFLVSSVLCLVETSAVENHEVKLAILKFLTCLCKLKAGMEHVKIDCVEFACRCLTDPTIFTVKAAQEYLNNLLLSSQANREVFASNFKVILRHTAQSRQVSMRFFELLESFLDNSQKSNTLCQVFVETQFEEILTESLTTTEDETLLQRISIVTADLYAKFAVGSKSPEWKTKFLKLVQLLLRRGFLKAAFLTVARSLHQWIVRSELLSFCQELLYLLLIPVHVDTEEIEVYYDFYQPHMKMWQNYASAPTRSLGELMKTMIMNSSYLDDLTHVAITSFVRSRQQMGKETALKVTRSLLFLLGCVKLPDCKRNSMLRHSPHLGISLVEAVCEFIQAYNIKWWESPETICVPVTITRLIKNNANLNTQVTCAALKGLRFCVSQFLHPNQALLLNSVSDSSLEELAEAVHRCCHSMHWEIRDSALEVVLEMAQLSASRFPAFQQLLIESGLLKTTLHCLKDSEAYVRATALSSAAAMVASDTLKEAILRESDLVAETFNVVENDTEAIARRAATKALRQLYAVQIAGEDEQRFLQDLSSAALNDLDWEVKLEALNFWDFLIEDTLRKQGMIDGVFPDVIFSAQKQRIIRLDPQEIRRCLQRALSCLSKNGCLDVVLQAADDYDAVVKEKALKTLSRIKNMLAKYDALDLEVSPQRTKATLETASATQSSATAQANLNTETVDSVIEEILGQNDLSLISQIIVDKNGRLESIGTGCGIPSQIEPSEFVGKINCLEIEDLLQQTSQSSDLHSMDMSYLLQDLQDCVQIDDGRPVPDCY